MGKRIEVDGKFYRVRRGELVQIPDEWVGKVTHPQTMRKRPSKMNRKVRRTDGRTGIFSSTVFKDKRDLTIVDLQDNGEA
jgi:hypothetical protein